MCALSSERALDFLVTVTNRPETTVYYFSIREHRTHIVMRHVYRRNLFAQTERGPCDNRKHRFPLLFTSTDGSTERAEIEKLDFAMHQILDESQP
jgi:hypothetical protein